MTSPKLSRPSEFAEFLALHGWLQPLARTLVEASDADDLVQDTWVQLVVSPPADRSRPRNWLARVVRNASRMRRRAAVRRLQRERRVGPLVETIDPETAAVRTERLRLLADLVEALDRPLREVIVQHYFEGRTLAEMARLTETPASTVRWRHEHALAELRRRLDERHGGDRSQWLAAWAPWLGLPRRTAWFGSAVAGVVAIAVVGLGATAYAITTRRAEPITARPTIDDPVVPRRPVAASARTTSVPRTPQVAPADLPEPRRSTSVQDEQDEQDPSRVAADRLLAARLGRLARIGDEALVATVSANPALLADFEQMMLMEDAADLASGCKESAPPTDDGMIYVDVRVVGAADATNLVEEVRIDDARSELEDAAFRTCLHASLFALETPPLAPGVAQTLSLFFDTDQPKDVLAGTVDADSAAP